MTRDVKEINVTGINITELQGEKRFRLQLEQKILLFVIILKVFRWKGNSRIANVRNQNLRFFHYLTKIKTLQILQYPRFTNLSGLKLESR